MSKWLKVGEARILEHDDWKLTVEDVADLAKNCTTQVREEQLQYSARIIHTVLAHLERRGYVDDEFLLTAQPERNTI
jgi:hypothetical protein